MPFPRLKAALDTPAKVEETADIMVNAMGAMLYITIITLALAAATFIVVTRKA